jgi:hypothetical protein
MARITPTYLHAKAERVSVGIYGPDSPGRIYCQRSATGWHVYQQFGAGAQALAECLTPGECQQFLAGLAVGCIITRKQDQ